MANPIRVLIVDDSALAGEVLASILRADPDIEVVGRASDGVEALEQVPRLKPDLITMDVWMPRMDGFTTVEQVMAYYPTPILVITASLARKDVDISLRMLAAGALDVIEKPSRIEGADWDRQVRSLVQRVKTLARVRVVTHLKGRRGTTPGNGATAPDSSPVANVGPPAVRPAPPPLPLAPLPSTPQPRPHAPGAAAHHPPAHDPAHPHGMAGRRKGSTGALVALPPHPAPGSGPRPELVVIASSTGGPQALLKILRGLPADFPLPILIVQHIAAGFTQGLADWLTREGGHPVRLAQAGERPQPGVALLAPDGFHMLLDREGRIALDDEAPREIRPSADRTMRSLVGWGGRVIAVILTGMGRDGADGMRAMRQVGAYTIAQDEATSVIFGMPRAAISLGVIDEVLPLDGIAPRLVALVSAATGGKG
jgi:two-component system chemotaxis response regulator CheB